MHHLKSRNKSGIIKTGLINLSKIVSLPPCSSGIGAWATRPIDRSGHSVVLSDAQKRDF